MSYQLSLVYPGLLEHTTELANTPASSTLEPLEWWLTLAEHISQPGDSVADLVWSQSGQAGRPPVAALSYLFDFGVRPSGPVLRADPVNLAADRDCLRLQATSFDSLDLAQAQRLCDEINHQFSNESWQLQVGDPQRWYLVLQSDAGIVSHSPQQAVGCNLLDVAISGHQATYWRKIINEIQMLLFQSDVNNQREASGLATVNSLWVWGEGELDCNLDCNNTTLTWPWARVLSDDPVVRGLAQLVDCTNEAAPASAEQLWTTPDLNGWVLCQPHCFSPQIDQPGAVLAEFSEQWLVPIYSLLRGRRAALGGQVQLSAAEVWAGTGVSYRLAAGKRRWWRRRRRIGEFMS